MWIRLLVIIFKPFPCYFYLYKSHTQPHAKIKHSVCVLMFGWGQTSQQSGKSLKRLLHPTIGALISLANTESTRWLKRPKSSWALWRPHGDEVLAFCLPSTFNSINVRLCSESRCHFQSEELCCKNKIDCVSACLSQGLVQLENTRLIMSSFTWQTLLPWTASISGV